MLSHRFFFPCSTYRGGIYISPSFSISPRLRLLPEHRLTPRNRFALWKMLFSKLIWNHLVSGLKSCSFSIRCAYVCCYVNGGTHLKHVGSGLWKTNQRFFCGIKSSVLKHCDLTTSGKFPNVPYRNIANLRLVENFQMVRSETLWSMIVCGFARS